ncbi:DUF4040 domain-containing protein [Baaleninema simplex]|uniref:DUF4040 domain-containing protein n=1 Tax=Baaleninema simplex TaxID=2862350 RepID=UPI00034643AB|nr:DUF4040 domain-containing protein [Baaleninema simplex]
MTEDWYVVAIVALLPLTAGMLVTQVNPYHALVIRGILGAVAALVYALFGAADVALTEALVGTMLSITLYAIAVRSSLMMRVGVLAPETISTSGEAEIVAVSEIDRSHPTAPVLSALRQSLGKYHMRLELVTYASPLALQAALTTKDVHTIWLTSKETLKSEPAESPASDSAPVYQLQTRVRRLYEILQGQLPPTAELVYVNPTDSSGLKKPPEMGMSDDSTETSS